MHTKFNPAQPKRDRLQKSIGVGLMVIQVERNINIWVAEAKSSPTDCCCGTHYINDFSIWWKFHLAIIQLLVIMSQQNFAHATTAQLSCQI